jgi:hypothetical protein
MNDENRCPGTNRNGEQCGHPEGWGTDNDTGPCKFHGGALEGGAREGAGAPERNRNAVSHARYSDSNLYYQEDCNDVDRALIDDIYADYHEDYVALHGEPSTGHDGMLFKVAVNIHKILTADDWPRMRPDALDSGHPLIDRSEKRTAQGDEYYQYVESAVTKAEKRLSSMVRNWLKDFGLLKNDEDTTVEVNVHEELLDGMKAAYEGD